MFPSNIRAGLGALDDDEFCMNNDLIMIQSILYTFMKRATHDASVYVKLAGRKIVTPKDIMLALKKQALPCSDGTNFMTNPNMAIDVHESMEELEGDQEYSDDDMVEEHEESVVTFEEEEWTPAPDDCGSDIVVRMNEILTSDEWEQWVPEDWLGISVKQAIEKCNQ